MPDKPKGTPAADAGPSDKTLTAEEITEIEARSFEPMYRGASDDKDETEEIPEADKRASDDAQDADGGH